MAAMEEWTERTPPGSWKGAAFAASFSGMHRHPPCRSPTRCSVLSCPGGAHRALWRPMHWPLIGSMTRRLRSAPRLRPRRERVIRASDGRLVLRLPVVAAFETLAISRQRPRSWGAFLEEPITRRLLTFFRGMGARKNCRSTQRSWSATVDSNKDAAFSPASGLQKAQARLAHSGETPSYASAFPARRHRQPRAGRRIGFWSVARTIPLSGISDSLIMWIPSRTVRAFRDGTYQHRVAPRGSCRHHHRARAKRADIFYRLRHTEHGSRFDPEAYRRLLDTEDSSRFYRQATPIVRWSTAGSARVRPRTVKPSLADLPQFRGYSLEPGALSIGPVGLAPLGIEGTHRGGIANTGDQLRTWPVL